MTSTAKKDWPRAYLLQIHQEAVAHGLIFIERIDEADAKSLKQRLYRVRRRSDTSTATFILPEYHMVTVGEWEPFPPSHPVYPGRLPIIYNRTPDGKPLPTIRPATPEEASAAFAPMKPLNTLPPLDPEQFLANLESADLTLKPGEVDSFVADLMKSAEKRAKKNED